MPSTHFVRQAPDSYAQNVSGSGQRREKSDTSRFATCQSRNQACIHLSNKSIVGNTHHLSSSLPKYIHQKLQNYVLNIVTNKRSLMFHKQKIKTKDQLRSKVLYVGKLKKTQEQMWDN